MLMLCFPRSQIGELGRFLQGSPVGFSTFITSAPKSARTVVVIPPTGPSLTSITLSLSSTVPIFPSSENLLRLLGLPNLLFYTRITSPIEFSFSIRETIVDAVLSAFSVLAPVTKLIRTLSVSAGTLHASLKA